MKQLHLFKPNNDPEQNKKNILLGPPSNPVGYEKYIASNEWKRKSNKAKELADHCCQKCGSKNKLETHHLHYNTLYRERFCDVEVLCASRCHKQADKNRAFWAGYETWMYNKYGLNWVNFDDEYHQNQFEEWTDREN